MKISALWICASVALCLAGCSNDNGNGTPETDGRVALQVMGEIQTRAHDDVWDDGDQIGIYMFVAGTSSVAGGVENVPYRKAETGNERFAPVADVIYYPVDGSNVDFYAWYPYQELTDGTWEAALTNQSSQSSLDLMTAEANSSSAAGGMVYNKLTPQVALDFHHRLTKLALTIAPGNGITAADLAGLKVGITGQVLSVTYQPEYDGLGTVLDFGTIPLLVNAEGTAAEAILYPNDFLSTSLKTGRQLIFTLNATGEVFYWNIPDTKSFNAGEKNIYNITINRTSLDVTSTVSNWAEGNGTGESGSAE